MTEQPIGEFAPADDVFAALESIPGIHDDRAERDAAREQMESQHRIGIPAVRETDLLR